MLALWLSLTAILFSGSANASTPPQRAAQAQGASRISLVGPQPGTLRVGDVARLRIRFEGDGRVELEEPKKSKDLVLRVHGPGRSEHTSIIGRRRSHSVSWVWELQLRPMRAGKYTLGPYRVRHEGKTYTSKRVELTAVEDVANRDAAFFDVRIEPERVYRQQRFAVVFRVGLVPDRVERLRRLVSHPKVFGILIEAPWWDDFPVGRPGGDDTIRSVTKGAALPINGKLRAAKDLGEIERGGRVYRVFEQRRYFMPSKVGRFELQQPSLHYEWVTRYAPDLFGNLSPAETRSGFARASSAPVIEVRDLPSEGRPPGFSNLVGRIEIRASTDKTRVKVGESFAFSLSFSGEADWELIEAPELRGFDGFHVYGKKVERRADGVEVRYDLSALEDRPKLLPAVELPHFDPSVAPEGAYRIAKSQPVPIEIEALPEGKGLEALPESRESRVAGVDDIWDRMALTGTLSRGFELSAALAWAGLLAPLLLFGLGWLVLNRLQWRAANPRLMRSRQALGRFEASLVDEGALRAFTCFVAERIGWDRGETVGEGLADRLGREGVSADLAARVERCVQDLLTSRYAGGDESRLVDQARDIARDFDRSVRP